MASDGILLPLAPVSARCGSCFVAVAERVPLQPAGDAG